MTEQDLDEIEARANAATPEPWTANQHGEVIQTKHVTRDVWFIPRTVEDSQFVAHARTDVPALVAEVRRQQVEIGDISQCLSRMTERAEKAEAEVERLREHVRKVLPWTMGGTPDLFGPEEGWDEWAEGCRRLGVFGEFAR